MIMYCRNEILNLYGHTIQEDIQDVHELKLKFYLAFIYFINVNSHVLLSYLAVVL